MSEHLSGSVSIRGLVLSDGPELAAAYVRNRDYLQPFDPVRPETFFTSEGQQDAVAHSVALQTERRGFFWILMDGPRIVGRISVSNVVRGAFQSGDLGYWVAEEYQGRGLASAAVKAVVTLARNEAGLHRIQAGTLLHNVASQKVLERSSFTRIGVAPKYLRINGEWADHLLFQRILHD